MIDCEHKAFPPKLIFFSLGMTFIFAVVQDHFSFIIAMFFERLSWNNLYFDGTIVDEFFLWDELGGIWWFYAFGVWRRYIQFLHTFYVSNRVLYILSQERLILGCIYT